MATSTSDKNWLAASVNPHRTLADKAFAALHDGIVSGALAPGERLRIEELATALGMSHLPIREAIRRLESTGLVEYLAHRGGRVAELSLDDLRELYEARLLLEPNIIARAAQQLSSDDAKVARAWLEKQKAAEKQGDLAAIWNAHTEFHFTLYRASGSSWLIRLVTPLWESSQRYRMTMAPLNSERRRREAEREHEEMLSACELRDSESAARVLHNHLVRTANLITDQMGGEHLFVLR